jgi:hypothetical protein
MGVGLQLFLIYVVYSCDKLNNHPQIIPCIIEINMENEFKSTKELAASITKAASLQTAATIHFLVDHNLLHDAYRAYAYFRWVDDWIDQKTQQKDDRMAFVARQNVLIRELAQGLLPQDLTPEEQMLAELVQKDGSSTGHSGLRTYIHNMIAVMAFDAERRGRLITYSELNAYAHTLAVAVTEALHYFIGQDCSSPRTEARYLAVTGAHITHMLRDTMDDNAAGYFNIPLEFLKANKISPFDINSEPYRSWVRSRVRLARDYFKAGRGYMAQVENFRCRLAGYAYIARFEAVLDSIEREDYLLRTQYQECKTLSAGIQMGWSTLGSAFYEKAPQAKASPLTAR